MNDRLALVSLTLLLLGLLALIVTGAVRDVIIIPLLALLWLLQVIYESIPEMALWVGFLAITAVVAWTSLAMPRTALPEQQVAPTSRAPVATWTAMFQRAADERYARWLLAQRLGQLGLELLNIQGQYAARGMWQYLRDESQDIPPAVRAYLQAGAQMYRPVAVVWWRWWPWGDRMKSRPDPLDLDPGEVVRFLDERLSRSIGEEL
jgi:hypothetical protein